MKTHLTELTEQRAELDKRIDAVKAQQAHSALHEAIYVFNLAGVPLDEAATRLMAIHKANKTPKRRPATVKYRETMTGQTWTGRGKKPTWFTTAEQQGTLERLSAPTES